MPLQNFPVVLPYRYEGEPVDQFHAGQAHVLASGPPAALATAQVLVSVQAILRQPGRKPLPESNRARIGSPGATFDGLYAYVITRNGPIHHLDFSARLDQDHGAKLGDVLRGLDASQLFGVVFDCQRLTYLNTMALASLAGNAERLHLHACRLSDPIRKVFEMVGINNVIGLHADLQNALAALIRELRTVKTPVPS